LTENGRAALGIPGKGPKLVITDRALFDFENEAREMTLIEVAPGETAESIQEDVGWPLRVSPDLKEMTPPEAADLAIIREQLDPEGLYR
jgi:glutaconate CoA-transferase subunit B